jgi:glutamate-1-semialdehyde 2,1-aminomutase
MTIDITKSLALQERAKKRIPGISMLLSKRPDMFSLGAWPGYFSCASGSRVTDLDGNTYVDMSIGGIGANVLGYADPDVDEAVRAVIAKGSSSSLLGPEDVDLADLLCELHPWAEMALFARSGGEAMNVAVRVARAHTRRDVVAFCGYHGWFDWYLAANVGTENSLGEHLISGLDPRGVPLGLAGTALPFRYNRLEELEAIVAAHPEGLAAVVMESIRDTAPEPGFIEGVRDLARKAGAVFIVDEISAGLRFLTGGAHLKYFNVSPDMAVFSKALGNGYPISALIGVEPVMQAAQRTFISSTNWTERVGPTAALATLRKHRALDAGARLVALGEAVQAGWTRQAERHGLRLHVGGIKPMSHFSFECAEPQAAKAYFIELMLEEGFLASTLFYAMHAHSDEDVERYLEATGRSFARIAEALERGDILARLKGKPSTVGFKRLT